jgi:hypothetical protein
MNGFHEGGSSAYRRGLKEDHAEKMRELDEQIELSGNFERESLERRKSELKQELKTKLAESRRMIH